MQFLYNGAYIRYFVYFIVTWNSRDTGTHGKSQKLSPHEI